MWRIVGIVGKASVQMKSGVFIRASRSACSTPRHRSSYSAVNAVTTASSSSVSLNSKETKEARPNRVRTDGLNDFVESEDLARDDSQL